MRQYRMRKLFADVWVVELWGVVNYDGILDHDWKHVKTYHGDNEAINGYEAHKWGTVSVGMDYFATYEDDGNVIALHLTFDDALDYIQETSAQVERVEEIGGTWDTFKKCKFCGEWIATNELNESGWCDHCEWYTTKGRC